MAGLIVAVHVAVEQGLHFLDGFEPRGPAFNAEVLVKQGAMQPLDGSSILVCSSTSSTYRSAIGFSSRSRRSCLVKRL